ncbi:hypothetical protein [Lacinutrix salivirga]
MKKPTLFCSVFGHKYEISKKVTYHVHEYKCKHCYKELTTNGNGNLIELTPKFKEINAILEKIHTNKMMRLNKENNYNQQRQLETMLNL